LIVKFFSLPKQDLVAKNRNNKKFHFTP
jgi:hypothetical protein